MNRFSKIKIILVVLILVGAGYSIYRYSQRSDEVLNIKNAVQNGEDQVSRTQKMVQIRFSFDVEGIVYNDAFNMTEDQYSQLTESQLEQMKRDRVENWVKTINEQSKKNE